MKNQFLSLSKDDKNTVITIGNPTDVVVDLGVTINEGLNWKSHVGTVSLKARQFAGWILRTFKNPVKKTS